MTRVPKTSGNISVRVAQLAHARGLPLPAYQTAGSAGLDLAAAVAPDAPVKLKPGQRKLIPTGLKLELPPGYEAQVRPRSGLALKHGITVLNSPGTIDSDYRGEVQVILVNLGKEKFIITRGERIAQMVIAPVTQAALTVVETVGATERGSGGFGSTGTQHPQEIRAARTKKKTVPKAAAGVTPAPRKAPKTRINRAKKTKR